MKNWFLLKKKEILTSFIITILVGLITLITGANLSILIGITFIIGLALGFISLECRKDSDGDPAGATLGTILATLLTILLKLIF